MRYRDPSGHDVDCGLAEPDCDKALRRQSSTPSSKKDAIDAWEMSPHMPPIAVATIKKGGKTTALYAGCSVEGSTCTSFDLFRLTYEELLKLIQYLSDSIDPDPENDLRDSIAEEILTGTEAFTLLITLFGGWITNDIEALRDYLLGVAIEMAKSNNFGPITLVVVTGLFERDASGNLIRSQYNQAVFVVLDNGTVPLEGKIRLFKGDYRVTIWDGLGYLDELIEMVCGSGGC